MGIARSQDSDRPEDLGRNPDDKPFYARSFEPMPTAARTRRAGTAIIFGSRPVRLRQNRLRNLP